ncbi:hypothetical protein THAR02_07815 [Trichoderma harzianum]|uniref:Velvet domain-containing protein n=1 Tax=Trichoderma harzianum TaxID=5544 RepID=A0A0F9ZII4_TRIHA|nr:hypothetical protein THAR02_07815 [Trichoderma harzianum]
MAVTELMYHPPVQALVDQALAPAITIEHPATDPTAIYYFATPVLLSATNTVVDGLLQGNRAVTGTPINGGATIQYTLFDLAISAPGTYYLRIDMYGMSPQGANFVTKTNPSLVTVST